MSWLRIRVGRGVLKIKPRRHMRWAERERLVPMLNLGFVIISWWSDEVIRRFK
jgi:hypothetical protein